MPEKHKGEETGAPQVVASDAANEVQFVTMDKFKEYLGINELEKRVAALESRAVERPTKDRVRKGEANR